MRDLRIKTKLICLVAFMSVVLAAVGWVGLNCMKTTRASLETVYKDRLLSVIYLATIEELLSDTRREMEFFVAEGRLGAGNLAVKDHEGRAARIETNLAEVQKNWRAYLATKNTPEELVLARIFWSSYIILVERGITPGVALMRGNDMTGLDVHLRDTVFPLDDNSQKALWSLIRLQDKTAKSELDNNTSSYRSLFTIFLVGHASVVLAGVLIGAITIVSVTRATNRLRESETRYRTLFESAHDAILIHSGPRIIDCNRKALEMFAGSREQLVGSTISDISADLQVNGKPTDDEIARRVSVSMGGQHQFFEWCSKRLDGSPFDTEVSLEPIEIGGEIVLQAVVRDITERKRTQKDLVESERRFRTLFEQAAVGVAEIDPVSGRFLQVNKRYCDIVGLPHDEMLKADFQSITHPDDVEADLNNLKALLAGEIHEYSMDKRYIRKDGGIVWVRLTVYPIWGVDEKPTHHIAVVEDITERKDAENALRSSEEKFFKAFHATPSGISISRTSDGLIFEVNEAYCSQIEYSRDELIGRTSVELNLWDNPHDRERYVDEMRKYGSVREMEAPFRTKSGRILDGIVFGEFIELDGEPCLLTVIRDVTKWKRADKELQSYRLHLEELVHERTEKLEAANQKLKELDRLKSMFIASMSHELRTPLNSIIGFTGMTLQGLSGDLNDEQKDNLSRAYQSARHLLSLITDVIDISKVEAGRIESFPEAVSLNEVVDEAIGTVQPQLKQKGLGLAVDVPGEMGLITDRKRLFQCLLNFLSNAVKYTESGTITVAARETDKGVSIWVSDTGIGIAEKDMPKLFEAFERFETHLRVKAGGTGLGLYLTKKIAREILRGDVLAQSKEGQGSTFTLNVPKDLRRSRESADISDARGDIGENSADH